MTSFSSHYAIDDSICKKVAYEESYRSLQERSWSKGSRTQGIQCPDLIREICEMFKNPVGGKILKQWVPPLYLFESKVGTATCMVAAAKSESKVRFVGAGELGRRLSSGCSDK